MAVPNIQEASSQQLDRGEITSTFTDGENKHFLSIHLYSSAESSTFLLSAGNLLHAALNGSSTSQEPVEEAEAIRLLTSTGLISPEQAREIYLFLKTYAEKANRPLRALIENAASYIEATTTVDSAIQNLRPGIFGSREGTVIDENIKDQMKKEGRGSKELTVGGIPITAKLDAQGTVYYLHNNKIIDGEGWVIALNKKGEIIGRIKVQGDKTTSVYDAYKKAQELEGASEFLYVYKGALGRGENKKPALIVEKLGTSYRDGTHYYGPSVLTQLYVQNKVGKVAVLQFRVLNVNGTYQTWYRLLSLEEAHRLGEDELRFDKWMRFNGEASFNKR
ncbi:MAG: hypothetical protein GXN92_01240, partial [Candidatus Micrarchaeota archaeon]|nr:hypothetical protein [Candidatus Micrarchaeota archaeon]